MDRTVLISAGGTGGHMSPASALATELKKRGVHVELATDIRGTRYEKMFPGIKTHVLKSGTAGAGLSGKIKGALGLAQGILLQGLPLIGKVNPDFVIGFGGYPSVPAVLAAQLRGVPTGLHEQNAILGKANKFLAPRARFIALSLRPTQEETGVLSRKMVVTGNPVRPEIIALKEAAYPALDEAGLLNILVMGGSLGATVFSKVVPEAIAMLPKEYKNRISVVQQCREADIEEAQDVYEKAIVEAELAPFFHDVAGLLSKSHLFIGRSGASTVAEISIAGRPAIYVPYPHHKDQQQKKNAMTVADRGGAWIVSENQFTPETVKERITMIFENPDTLSRAAARAKDCGLPDAAERLADQVIKQIQE